MYTDEYEPPYKQTERQSNMIFLIDYVMAYDKIQQAYIIKVLERLGIKHNKSIPNSNLSGKKLKAIPLNSETR